VLKKLENAEYLEYVGLGIALAGLVQWMLFAVSSIAMLFFGPLIMAAALFLLLPYGLAAVVLGWLSRKRNAAVAWVTIAIGVFLPAGSVTLVIILGEMLWRATA